MKRLLLAAVIYSSQAQAWSLFGPKNYEDCVLENIKNAQTREAAALVKRACENKFPKPLGDPCVEYLETGNVLLKTLCDMRKEGK